MENNKKIVKSELKQLKNNQKNMKKLKLKKMDSKLVYFHDFGELLIKKVDEAMEDSIGDSMQYPLDHEWCEVLELETACQTVMKTANKIVEALRKKAFCHKRFLSKIEKERSAINKN